MSEKELWDLKAENDDYDLDTAFDYSDRSKELTAAIGQGTRVIWLLAPQKHVKVFGWRSIYIGYANEIARKLVESGTLREKNLRRLFLKPDVGEFKPYFERLKNDGWKCCLSDFNDTLEIFAKSLEGYGLGGQVKVGSAFAWLLTPPSTQEATNLLINFTLGWQHSVSLPRPPTAFLSLQLTWLSDLV